MTYKVIKHNYDRGLWNETMVRMCVKKGVITQAQYEQVIGQVDTPVVE